MAETAQERLQILVARIKKVRRWLLALAILKVAGLSTVFVSTYVGVYAWLDHHLKFGLVGRTTAFVLLVAGAGFLLYRLARYLVSHISYSQAANFIESRHSFNQQLVTAVEFYEKQQDYPYSRTLAEQLVLQVCKDSEGFKFDSTIDKWQGYVFTAIILFGAGIVLFYVRANYLYISSYFARLTHPLATVEPLAPTSLQPITRDIVAEPNSPVTFAADIEGQVPESGKLVLVPVEPNTTDSAATLQREEIEILPTLSRAEGPHPAGTEKAKLIAAKSFAQTGLFKYRFEAPFTSTEWHQIDIHQAPQIESITAEVLLPSRPPRNMRVKPYTEQVTEHSLEVMPDSTITLSVQATGPLREAAITGLDGQAITKQLDGADQFTFSFTANQKGAIRFRLVDEQGLANDNVPDVAVTIRNDEPPEITLISPDGDYIATNVASVPITFEFSDDFGLDAAEMVLEIPRQQPKQLTIPITRGEKTHRFSHTVELEQYDLLVGDSILFHAQASDIDTGSALPSRSSTSDVYFIEIRPYRQNWHPKPGGGQGSGGAAAPEELLNILEYTRAILKKTWPIADKPTLTDEDRGRLKAINDDVQYCATQLATMRDDSEYGFDEQGKAILDRVLQSYGKASENLARHDASAALPPEKEAYSILRKFILELEMLWSPPQSGQSQAQAKPDSIRLQESPELSQLEKERIEAELKKVQQKLETLSREQKLLKADFVNFLDQQAQQKALSQESKDQMPASRSQSKSAQPLADKQAQAKPSTSQEDKSRSAQKGESASDGKSTSGSQNVSQGTAPSSPPGQSSEGTQTGAEGGQPGRGEPGESQSPASPPEGPRSAGTGDVWRASTEARLRMLQAKQKALQEKVSQLNQDLNQLPAVSEAGKAQAQQKAQEHLADALAKMDQFQNAVTATRYQPKVTGKKATEAVELMESARQKLEQATSAIEQGLSMSQEQRLAEKAQEIAEQLAQDADDLDESLTPVQREEMLARLEAAKRLLDSMAQAQWSMVNKGSNQPAAAHVFTKNPRLAPAEAARAMARQFWSIAIEAKKQKSQLAEDEPSDVKFYELENKFFENAAKFSKESVKRDPASRDAK